ncbi:MAG: DUF881 domain-containing protein [Bacillota bacterium]
MRWPMYISITLVALVTGLLLTFQFRVSSRIEQGVPAGRAQELATELHQLDAEISRLQSEVSDLEAKLLQATKGQQQALAAMAGELTKAKIAAGLTAVSGPGIEITLDNPPLLPKTGRPASLYVIRDEDLLRIVNELRGAGAEAVSINGQRIVATSEIRFAAPFINVNLTRIVPPYHVLAIGKTDHLQAALSIPGGVVEYLKDLGVRVEIQPHDKLTVPAYTGTRQHTYAKPVQSR